MSKRVDNDIPRIAKRDVLFRKSVKKKISGKDNIIAFSLLQASNY